MNKGLCIMNKVTHVNLEVIDYLYTCKPSTYNLSRSPTLNASLLKEVEGIIDPNAIYLFIPLMFVENKMVSRLANEKVTALLNMEPLHLLNKIDEEIRKLNFPRYDPEMHEYWFNLRPSIVDYHPDHSIECCTRLKILCCHPNGYIRYKAIKTLAKNNIQAAVPFLIIRTNDWVEEIRILCLATLNSTIKNEIICHFIESLPLLKQLKVKGRHDHRYERTQLIRNIESVLATQCSAALFTKINSHEIISARYAFSIFEHSNSEIEQLLTATRHSRDIIIRLNALNLANKRYDSNQFLIYLNKIKNDKLMLIRKKVLYAFVEHYPYQAKGILEHALLDRSRSIRNLSRYYLKQQGISEFSHYYRDALTGLDKTIKSAILGLSESGNTDDFRYIRPFITKNIPGLNTAIINAAFKLQPEDWKNIITHLLSKPDVAILKSFVNCLLEHQESYTFEEILGLVYKKNNLMHLCYLIKILSKGHYDKWMVLNFILCELRMIDEHEIKVVFEKYLHTWIGHNSPNKIFTRPSHEKLKRCLDEASHLLKDNPSSSLYKELLENIQCFIK